MSELYVDEAPSAAVPAMSDLHAEGGAPREGLILPAGIDRACKNLGAKELSEELRERKDTIRDALELHSAGEAESWISAEEAFLLRRRRRVEGIRERKALGVEEALLDISVDADPEVWLQPPPSESKLARDATEALRWIEAKGEREVEGIEDGKPE